MTYQILIVDDEPIVRNGLLNFDWEAYDFKAAGACENGREALEWLAGRSVDVVLSDIKMPGIDGVELSEKIRELYPNILVVLLSGYNEFAYAQQAIKTGVFDYLLKPAEDEDFEILLEKCRKVLEEREEQKRNELQKWEGLSAILRKVILLTHRIDIHAISSKRMEQYLSEILLEIESNETWQKSTSQLMSYLMSALEGEFAKQPIFPYDRWIETRSRFMQIVDKSESFEAVKQGLFLEVGEFIREMNNENAQRKDSNKLDDVLLYIQEHYDEVVSLDRIAEQAAMHPNTFSKWFKESKGMNFIDYLTRFRIDKSKELLEQTDMKMGQIAESVGIPDSRYFGQVFKKWVELTPMEYRSLFRSSIS